MRWNWQQPDWPRFTWREARLAKAEEQFLLNAGVVVGAIRHMEADGRDLLAVQVLSEEAVTTSEIEGEILDRASVQSSIRRELGLSSDRGRASPAEQGISRLAVDLYRRAAEPLRRRVRATLPALPAAGGAGRAIH